MDVATRAFIIAISTDIFFCIVAPALMLYGSPAVKIM